MAGELIPPCLNTFPPGAQGRESPPDLHIISPLQRRLWTAAFGVCARRSARALPWNHLRLDTNVSTEARTKSNYVISRVMISRFLIRFSREMLQSVL
ncbi:hypothetical protein SKAU_G00073200 [Synaphobranchus kaupii]|uniref:Uncharacterized protein n=1 Tax=Synaphobranchus kaupii TaxID=118154 RepID=A0A9Q1JBX1_SYNKA|nr:hypothetical protein SKAU_G00073200 [Synaphobranchus kaupii]